ncbi:hypothetical protein WICMUC_000327 [Wickerhamomyces mucosus]|uniref:Exoribonuclease phosphorolytic domain-containing protein n=1 Tax=Wickerhamomyces mucosus TaxID=1378264 RepID=A0A9P8PXZ6_9ASCO|nr:hypothetical protein WICMUC_000327 [Wickerhamomyces mucosus]
MSTLDRRRILGPANVKPLIFGLSSSQSKQENKIEEEEEEDINSQISKTFIKTGLITNANGSSYLEYNGNIISVSIYGPRPVRGTFTEKTSLDVHLDDNTETISDLLNKKFCNYIENNFTTVINLNKYPKSGISIFINVLSINNFQKYKYKLLSLISDATTIALINSGIEIIDIVSSTFDLNSNTVISFIKSNEIVGLLSDSNKIYKDVNDFNKIIKKLGNDSNIVKNSLINYLMSGN